MKFFSAFSKKIKTTFLFLFLVSFLTSIWSCGDDPAVETQPDGSSAKIQELESELSQLRESQKERSEKSKADQARYQNHLRQKLAQMSSKVSSRTDSSFEALQSRISEVETRLKSEIESLSDPGSPDSNEIWGALIGPIVKLKGEGASGSGVLLVNPRTDLSPYETFILTAWHVPRRIQAGDRNIPIPVQIYTRDNYIEHTSADLLTFDSRIDVALLGLNQSVAHAAKLPSRPFLENLEVLQKIAAVGCAKGLDPIPTFGEISRTDHRLRGSNTLMINADTYKGNSGGGIFDEETHYLIGILSRIYTAQSGDVIPHLGIAIPLEVIYDYFIDKGYDFLVPPEVEEPSTEPHAHSESTPLVDPS